MNYAGKIKHVCNLHVYNVQFKNFIMISDLIMISVLAFIWKLTYILTIQIILYHFGSDFYDIYFYYSDHIILFWI